MDDQKVTAYDNMRQCSAAKNIPFKTLRRIKNLGCKAFRHKVIYDDELDEWIKENSHLLDIPEEKLAPVNRDRESLKNTKLLNEIKLQELDIKKKSENLLTVEETMGFIQSLARSQSNLFNKYKREYPLKLSGKSAGEIEVLLGEMFSEIIKIPQGTKNLNPLTENKLYLAWQNEFAPPYTGSLCQWAKENVIVPETYAISGPADLSLSPYLIKPSIDLLDPTVRQVNICSSPQIGKSFLHELWVLFLCANDAGRVLKYHPNMDAAKHFNKTRLVPMLQSCKITNQYLKLDKYAVSNEGVKLPHMDIKCVSQAPNYLKGFTAKYIILDDAQEFEVGVIEKVYTRQLAFAQTSKTLICANPNMADSDLHKNYLSGKVYEWQWKCPTCFKFQPYRYTHRRENNTFSGLNWNTIKNSNGETNINSSAESAYLECDYCYHHVEDTISNRRLLNDTGEYICIKSDGNPSLHSYTCPLFVNIGVSFASIARKGMESKRLMKQTGLREDWITFVNQCYGAFFKQAELVDQSKIVVEQYAEEIKEKVRILTVDVQSTGNIKYWIVQDWSKSGQESRVIDFGVSRTFDEIAEIQKKYNILNPCVGIDSGFDTQNIYQETVKRGYWLVDKNGQFILDGNGYRQWIAWTCLKGSSQANFQHQDGTMRLISPVKFFDPEFPNGHLCKGINAKLYHWSNYSIKTILTKLRDNQMNGVKWTVGRKDTDFESQMYSEGLVDKVDKKTGVSTVRWEQTRTENHYFDAACMNLTLAIMFGYFSSISVDSNLIGQLSKEDIQKELEAKKK